MKRKSYFSVVAMLVLMMFVFGGCGGGGGGGGGNPPVPPVTNDAKIMREYNANFTKFTDTTFGLFEALRDSLGQELSQLPKEEVLSITGKVLEGMEKWSGYYSNLNSLSSSYHQDMLTLMNPKAYQVLGAVVAVVAGIAVYNFFQGIANKIQNSTANYTAARTAYLSSNDPNVLEQAVKQMVRSEMELNQLSYAATSAAVNIGGVESVNDFVVTLSIEAITNMQKNEAFNVKSDTKDFTTNVMSIKFISGVDASEIHGVIAGEKNLLLTIFKTTPNGIVIFDVPEGEKVVTVGIVCGEENAPVKFDVEVDLDNTVEIDLSHTPSVENVNFGEKIEYPTEKHPIEALLEVIGVRVECDPNPPFEFQMVTATATVFPAIAGVDVTFSVEGTDGYRDLGTIKTNNNGRISFEIPGAEASIRDVVKVSIPNGVSFQAVYTFQPLSSGASTRNINRVPRVSK